MKNRLRWLLVGMAALTLLFSISQVRAQDPQSPWWQPPLIANWQLQLDGRLNTTVPADVYDIDLVDTDPAQLALLHSHGVRTICYISFGTVENWRSDARRFPHAVVGRRKPGVSGERYLDIRRLDILAPIMQARLNLCKQKGFDAVDSDNLDAFTAASGFPLTAADQLRYNRWVASEAHARGLAVGLRNDPQQAVALVEDFDFAVSENCFVDGWCSELSVFVAARKPVFAAEYTDSGATLDEVCPAAAELSFNAIVKRSSLRAFRLACPLSPNPTATLLPTEVQSTSIPTDSVTSTPLETDTVVVPSATTRPSRTPTDLPLSTEEPSVTSTILPSETRTPRPSTVSTIVPTMTPSRIPTQTATLVVTERPTTRSTTIPSATNTRAPVATRTPVLVSTETPRPTAQPTVASSGWWKPTADQPIHWHWQLSEDFVYPRDVLPGVTVYDIDGEQTSAETVAQLHALGPDVIVICYFDAGVYEDYRSDKSSFLSHPEVIGNEDDGWPGSYWLDIRQTDILLPIMRNRMQRWCKDKGFDAIEPDETEVWSNDSGFPITKAENNYYNQQIAAMAHEMGLSVGLKGNTTEAPELWQYFDWSLNEQCWEYTECDNLQTSFLAHNKAVFNIEYNVNPDCATSNNWHMNSARRDLDLVGPTHGDYLYSPCMPDTQSGW